MAFYLPLQLNSEDKVLGQDLRELGSENNLNPYFFGKSLIVSCYLNILSVKWGLQTREVPSWTATAASETAVSPCPGARSYIGPTCLEE